MASRHQEWGRAVLLVAVLTLQSCTAARDPWPVERLDPHSAVTTTIMAEPWVYARDVPAVAVNARDYLHVGLVETNRAGLRGVWLGIVAWSTVDRSALRVPTQPVRPGQATLNWSDGTLELAPAAGGREAIGASEPVFPGPQTEFEDAWYLLSAGQLARLAREPPASVSLTLPDGRVIVYESWKVGREALDPFLAATGVAGRR